MYTNLIYLVTVLLLVSMAVGSEGFIFSPWIAFIIGMGCYLGLLCWVPFQNSLAKKVLRRRPGRLLGLINLELIGFTGIFYFFLGADRIFPDSMFIPSLFSVLLYFSGLWVHYRTAFSHLSFVIRNPFESSGEYAGMQLRMVIPFALPFLLYSGLMDIGSYYPVQNGESSWEPDVTLIGSLVFFAVVMIFFPMLIQKVWKCEPIEDPILREKLEALCKRAGFKHAGMRIWTILNHALTAGIIGVVPRYRYVMFTKRLLKSVSPGAVEAILAHEIAHSQKKHLLIYPFILFGGLIVSAYFFLFFSEAIETFGYLHPMVTFICFTLILAIYFRVIFGYFSRLFERQADLNVFELNIPHCYMMEGLDTIGRITGNSHRVPSWHHYSIQERIDFINEAALDPKKIKQHNKKVKRNVIGYFFFLLFSLWFLFFPPENFSRGIQVISHKITELTIKTLGGQ